MTSPLEQAQHLKEGCNRRYCFGCNQYDNEDVDAEAINCGTKGLTIKGVTQIFLCPECKAKAQTLLETCEWMINGLEEDNENGLSWKDERMIEQAISICKEILK